MAFKDRLFDHVFGRRAKGSNRRREEFVADAFTKDNGAMAEMAAPGMAGIKTGLGGRVRRAAIVGDYGEFNSVLMGRGSEGTVYVLSKNIRP